MTKFWRKMVPPEQMGIYQSGHPKNIISQKTHNSVIVLKTDFRVSVFKRLLIKRSKTI